MKKAFGIALIMAGACTFPAYAEDAATEPDSSDTKEASSSDKPAASRMSSEELRYVANLSRKIKKNWPKPDIEDRKELTVSLIVEEEGKVSGLKVVKSTESEELDQSGLDAITRSAPFGAPPESMKLPKKLQFTFVFQKTEKEEAKTESKEEG